MRRTRVNRLTFQVTVINRKALSSFPLSLLYGSDRCCWPGLRLGPAGHDRKRPKKNPKGREKLTEQIKDEPKVSLAEYIGRKRGVPIGR